MADNKSDEKRKYQRFSDTTLLYNPIEIAASPPFLDKPIQGNLLNLSSGGLAILISKEFPKRKGFHIKLVFPDRTILECDAQVSRVIPKHPRFEVGLKFKNLPQYMEKKISNMAKDYNACEDRIFKKDPIVCHLDCSFYVICQKPQKSQSEDELGQDLLLHVDAIED